MKIGFGGGGYPAYPKRTQGYAKVERGLGKWSAKIKIGQANHLDVTNKWFLFLGSPYVSVFRNWATKTVKIGFGGRRACLCLRGIVVNVRRRLRISCFWDIYDLFVAMFSPAAFAH